LSSTQKTLLIAVLVVLVSGVGAALWWIGRDSGPMHPVGVSAPLVPTLSPAEPPPPTEPARLAADDTTQATYGTLDTTVVFPLEVALELVHSMAVQRAEGAPPLGSGATARVSGSIKDAKGEGVRGEVAFVAGTNQGRVLYCDSTGSFGAKDLYPGISIVKVTGPATPGSMRELRLRQDRDSELNIFYGRPAHVFGQVFDADSKPVAGAKVTLDGQEATTLDNGVFEFTNMASGEVLAIVEKQGYAAYREILNVAGGTRVDVGQIKFLLQKSARLQVSITEPINAGEQALLFLLPEVAAGQRKFPWQRVNPVRIWPGGTTTIEDLPSGAVTLRLYHAGAVAKPVRSSVSLSPGETTVVTLHLEPSPVLTGVVTDGGKPVSGAIVRMEVPDRVHAMLSAFGESNYLYLENDVFPNLPPAVQEVSTNERGEYSMSANESISDVRYLTALSRDQKRIAQAVVKPGMARVDLALAAQDGGTGEIIVQMTDRIQPLPVKVRVNGAPRDPFDLPAGKDLHIGALPAGSWLVTIQWNGSVLASKQPVELRDEVSIQVKLPDGAIQGQDADTVKRVRRR
jgi:hypothetical protein